MLDRRVAREKLANGRNLGDPRIPDGSAVAVDGALLGQNLHETAPDPVWLCNQLAVQVGHASVRFLAFEREVDLAAARIAEAVVNVDAEADPHGGSEYVMAVPLDRISQVDRLRCRLHRREAGIGIAPHHQYGIARSKIAD